MKKNKIKKKTMRISEYKGNRTANMKLMDAENQLYSSMTHSSEFS